MQFDMLIPNLGRANAKVLEDFELSGGLFKAWVSAY